MVLKIEYTIVIENEYNKTVETKKVYDETAVFEYLIRIAKNGALLEMDKITIYKEIVGAETSMHSNKRILLEIK